MISTLKDNFSILKLDNMFEDIISKIDDKKVLDILTSASSKEIKQKELRGQNQLINMAGFPSKSTIEEFDFKYNEQIQENRIKSLLDMKFIDNNENIIFVGTPGVGKTHLATAFGIQSAKKKNSTYFIKCHKLLMILKQAYEENRLEEKLKHYARYKVLIIDEIGFLPITELESKILFQLIDKRYEKKPTIITTNILFEKWNELFSDSVIANAILDRLLHHSHVFKIIGESYRLKDVLNSDENMENSNSRI